jgi:uncharacterized membrane protein YphA (DoxX/SURF4 family)
MNSLTRVFLVLLRLAIGWHFLFEGIEKIQSVDLGPTETNRPWSSEGYLREACGPLGEYFRRAAGDPDDEALAKLEVPPLPADVDPGKTPPYTRLPAALTREWDGYYDRFIRFYTDPVPLTLASYDLTPEEIARSVHHPAEVLDAKNNERQEAIAASDTERLKCLAECQFKQAKDDTANWLLMGKKRVKKPFPSGIVEKEETTPQRVAEYRQKWQDTRTMQDQELPAFDHDVLKKQLRNAKADVARLRNDLLRDLADQTANMKKTLQGLLTPAQKKLGNVPELVVVRPSGWLGQITPDAVAKMPAWVSAQRPVDWIDLVTRYGLTAVGACLILGLFTRTACLGGAAFLLMFYLAMPPLPWVPENLRTEGHYLFVNKNLIEMLALLTLATTRSGYWAGVDGIVRFLCPWRWRTSRRTAAAPNSRPNTNGNLSN